MTGIYLFLVPHNNPVQAEQFGYAHPCLIPHRPTGSLDQQVIGAGSKEVHQEMLAYSAALPSEVSNMVNA